MPKTRMTKLRLLADLRRRLSRPDTKVKLKKMTICGQCTWKEEILPDCPTPVISEVTIYLDPRRDGRVRLVIHELLHAWMQQHFFLGSRMVYELEEVAICAWEDKLYAYLHAENHAAELENWDRAIRRKLEG